MGGKEGRDGDSDNEQTIVSGTLDGGIRVMPDGEPPARTPGEAPAEPPEEQDPAIGTVTAAQAAAVSAAAADTPDKPSTQTRFKPADRTRVLERLKIPAETSQRQHEKPPVRKATYLVMDSKILDGETAEGPAAGTTKALKVLRSEIQLLINARDFDITQDENGNIVVLAFSERGGVEKLISLAQAVRRADNRARMVLKMGQIEHHGFSDFSLTGYPDWKTAITASEATIFIDAELAGKIRDKNSRIGSAIEIETETFGATQADASFLLALKEAKSKVKLERGGPDRLIGYEGYLEALQKYTGVKYDKDDHTKFILLEARAGDGKSCLVAETLEGPELTHPSYVLCSIDPSDKNVVGSGLVTVAKQLIDIIREDQFIELDEVQKVQVKTGKTASRPGADMARRATPATEESLPVSLAEFASWNPAAQINFAARNAQAVSELLLNALVLLNFNKAQNTLFVLEDIHHADRVSIPFITQLIYNYLTKTEGRALASLRPEEMFRSTAIDDLERQINSNYPAGRRACKHVTIKNGLDLENAQLAHDFAYHSLPENVRTGRTLGDWYKVLGKAAARSPLMMKSLMDAAQEVDADGNYKWLEVGTTIELKEEFLERVSRIDPNSETDIATYFHERIANLDEAPRKILQAIALMGGRVHSDQIGALIKGIVKDKQKFREVAFALMQGGYLQKIEADTYGLQHESIQTIVIGSIADDQKRAIMARDLYEKFKNDNQLHPDAKHSLLAVIAQSDYAPRQDDALWNEYLNATIKSLEYAQSHNDTGNTHRIATEVLRSNRVQKAVQKLKDGEEVPQAMAALTITALTAQAESARFLGKFDEVDEAVEALTTIHAHFTDLVDIRRANKVRFEKAYMLSRPEEMQKIYDRRLAKGVEEDNIGNLMLQIKLAYKQNRFNEAIAIFTDNETALTAEADKYEQTHDTPLPEFVEIMRIVYARCLFERARYEAMHRTDGLTFDGDVLMQPGALSEDQKREMEEAKSNLEYIEKIVRRHPLILDRYAELNILDQKAMLAAFLGDHAGAEKLFHESWRVATQMEVHNQAARAAKLKGDVQVMRAMAERETENRRALLVKAIATYSEEGDQSLQEVSKSFPYQYLRGIQRIRAIGLFLTEHELNFESGGALDLAKTEVVSMLKPYVETALEDFKYLNDNWTHSPLDEKTNLSANDEFCYDIMGYVARVLYVAEQMSELADANLQVTIDPDLHDPSKTPFLTLPTVAKGRAFGDSKVTDNNYGEVDRKRKGLGVLIERLRTGNWKWRQA